MTGGGDRTGIAVADGQRDMSAVETLQRQIETPPPPIDISERPAMREKRIANAEISLPGISNSTRHPRWNATRTPHRSQQHSRFRAITSAARNRVERRIMPSIIRPYDVGLCAL